MFIRLTKRDGSPVWINVDFIVTVESVRTGGAVVVPSGDGLDYEVRESAEDIFKLIGEDAVQEVPLESSVEVPCEAPSSKESEPAKEEPVEPSPEPLFEGDAVPVQSESETAAAVTAVMQLSPDAPPPVERPSKRARKAKTRPAPAGTPATDGERKPTRRRAARKTPLALTEDQLKRVRTMAPRSVKRLSNTLSSQFAVTDPETTIRALVEHDIIQIDDQSHITWL
jgi:uncharacterized protein YlzI (FlbEa/FlbD family)